MAPAMAPVVAAAFTGFRREAPSTRACRCGRGTVPLSEVVAPEGKLRAWVEEHYVHVPLREKGTGTKLEALYASYFFHGAAGAHEAPRPKTSSPPCSTPSTRTLAPIEIRRTRVTSLYLLRRKNPPSLTLTNHSSAHMASGLGV